MIGSVQGMMIRVERRWLAPLFLLLLLLSCLAPQAAAPVIRKSALDEVAPYRRMLWVTRWDYRSAEDIARICRNAASARFTDIFFQVRGEGTVFYRSEIEPWAWELSGRGNASGTGVDPGWDPLAMAIAEAGKYGLRLHAYMNVLPVWAQKTPPPAECNHVLARHPNWLMCDVAGQPMKTDWYRFIDPALPEVRAHLAALFAEVARKYAVDGIHLDYIRYPYEKGDFSYAKPVVEGFRLVHGGEPAALPEQWRAFRRAQITETVRAISTAVRRERPGIEISAAVIAHPDRSETMAGQEPAVWLAEGLVDAITPMAYTGVMADFEKYASRFNTDLRQRIWLGVLADPAKNDEVLGQVRRTVELGYGGVAVFAYANLFTRHAANGRARAMYEIFAGGGGE